MARPHRHDDDWEDEAADFDEGDREPSWGEEQGDADDGHDTIPCPYCRRQIYEDSPRCPYCEQYLSKEDAPPSRKPWWIIVGVVLCLYAVYRWVTGR